MTKEIRRVVWPELRERGFAAFTGRTAWRYVGDAVDVVNFQSFGSSLADAVGCTTFSINLESGGHRTHGHESQSGTLQVACDQPSTNASRTGIG